MKLFELIRHVMSMILLIVLFSLLQYIFVMHFVCSCKLGLHLNGVLYMVLPHLILIFIVIIVESLYQGRLFPNSQVSIPRASSAFFAIFKRPSSSLSVLLLFGCHWFFLMGIGIFCLKTNFNSTQTGIPCQKSITTMSSSL